jgi:hypothetical protein
MGFEVWKVGEGQEQVEATPQIICLFQSTNFTSHEVIAI